MKATFERISFCVLLLGSMAAWANPSTFPETAVFAQTGYSGSLAFVAGGELLIPTPYLDTSAQFQVMLDAQGRYGARLSGTALVFPAIGITPPLALGLGADLGYDAERGFNLHAGVIAGSDLLFVARLPLTLSAYLAPGYAAESGFSLAWALQARYYLDDFALELASSDLLLVGVGVRYLF